jgi:ABC-type glycerol-3-phosphate transport system substrate-binding protein
MHLLAGFALALVTLAFVQSRPALPQLDEAPVARANINDLVALGNQFGINSLDGVLGLFPQYAGLVQQLTSIADQVANALSPAQLFTLEQQAIRTAKSVLSGNVSLQDAVEQLFAQVQQALGQDSPILNNVQPVVQQLLSAVAPLLALVPSNLGQRSAPAARANINDLLALANQGLVQQFTGIAHQVINALTPSQLETLEQQLILAAQNVLSGGVSLQDTVNQVFTQLQQTLGSDSAILSNVQPVVQQLVSVFAPLLSLIPSNLGQRSAPAPRVNINDLLALANQGLAQQFTGIAHQVINALSPSQLETLEQQIVLAAQSVLSGGVPLQDAVNQVLAQLQQALGSDSAILSNVQPVVQQFVSVVGPLLSLFSSNLVG